MNKRKAALSLVGLSAIAAPAGNAWAAAHATAPAKTVTTTRKFPGSVEQASRWGDTQVVITVKKTVTTVGSKKTTAIKILKVDVPVYPQHTDRSIYINQQAIPYLTQEAVQLQSANIQLISGATDLSYAFAYSLQSAILQAKK